MGDNQRRASPHGHGSFRADCFADWDELGGKHLAVLIAASRTEVIGRQLRNVSRLLVEADSVFRLLPREEF